MSKRWMFGLVALVVGCAAPTNSSEDEPADEIAVASEDALHASSSTRASLLSSRALFGGTRAVLGLRVRKASGAPVTSFEIEHTKPVHLIIVSHDLSYFTHVHPTAAGQGRFRIDWTPHSVEDDYTIYAQYRPTGAPELITSRFSAHAPATAMKAPVPVTEATAPVVSGNSKLSFVGESPIPSGPTTVKLQVTNAANGQPADLGTFLGARSRHRRQGGGVSGPSLPPRSRCSVDGARRKRLDGKSLEPRRRLR